MQQEEAIAELTTEIALCKEAGKSEAAECLQRLLENKVARLSALLAAEAAATDSHAAAGIALPIFKMEVISGANPLAKFLPATTEEEIAEQK